MNDELLAQLERVLLIYERTKELELKRAEMSAKIASDILAQNRKATFDLMQQFSQFIVPPKKDE
jgi:hypothetical protein